MNKKIIAALAVATTLLLGFLPNQALVGANQCGWFFAWRYQLILAQGLKWTYSPPAFLIDVALWGAVFALYSSFMEEDEENLRG